MSNEYLHALRAFELNQAMSEFPAHGLDGGVLCVLDVGVGTGYQATMLESLGCKVTAVGMCCGLLQGMSWRHQVVRIASRQRMNA